MAFHGLANIDDVFYGVVCLELKIPPCIQSSRYVHIPSFFFSFFSFLFFLLPFHHYWHGSTKDVRMRTSLGTALRVALELAKILFEIHSHR